MTKNDFILKAMLQMAANEKYVNIEKAEDDENAEFPSLDIECIFIDAEALADEAEKRLDDPFDQPVDKPSYSDNEYMGSISVHIEEIKDALEDILETLEGEED
jgi:hypothetical protein